MIYYLQAVSPFPSNRKCEVYYMPLDLNPADIVNSFKKRLPLMTFIEPHDHTDIATRLDVLIDVRPPLKRFAYSRLQKMEASRWLWDKLLSSSLSAITDNLRGYDELRSYFAQYIRYENLLFAVDRRHRDHVIHSIWVMLIGFYLLEKCRPLSPIDYSHLLVNYHSPSGAPPNMTACQRDINQREPVLWLLISLTHDLGYPIQKTREANELMSSMIDNFGFLERQQFTYNFTILQNTAIEELLNILSTHLAFTSNLKHRLIFSKGIRLDYAKSFERLDHGIMSAYLLINLLDYICDTMDYPSDPTMSVYSTKSTSCQATIIAWLSAITEHTAKNRYWNTLNDISLLLVLADELDEFSRYSHDTIRDRWVRIACDVAFTCTRRAIHFHYVFPANPEFDSLSFFRNKVAKLMNRFQLRSGQIELISLTSTHLKPKRTKYHFQKTFQDRHGTVRRINGKTATDVHKWIAGEEVL